MEKHLRKITKTRKFYLSSLIILFVSFTLTSQTPSLIHNIRFNMWANVDAYPGLEDAADYEGFEYPIKQIKEIAPFLVNGMVCGWEFSYTPYDKKRGVDEYLEINEIVPEVYVKQGIKYSSPWIEDNKFNCWIDYKRSDYDVQTYNQWSTIKNPVISGRGYGKVDIGFNGIKDAAEDALKEAIRNHYRPIIKNKPKEIRGKVLIKEIPVIGVDEGRYAINLDFFLEWGKIIEYTVF